jgi:hypothetical protein
LSMYCIAFVRLPVRDVSRVGAVKVKASSKNKRRERERDKSKTVTIG